MCSHQFCKDFYHIQNNFYFSNNFNDFYDFQKKYHNSLKKFDEYNELQEINNIEEKISIASGFKFQSENIKTDILIDHLDDLKNKNRLNEINTTVKNFNKDEYFFSGKKAAILAENNEIHEAINSILHEITKEKGFVVVGRDVIFNILPEAEVKIFLFAEFNIRALKRAQQLNSDNITNIILLDIINHDSKSFTLFTEAKKVSKLIDTTELTLADIVDLILTQKVSNEIDISAFEIAFPNAETRITFARNLLDYYNAYVAECKRIEKIMPKNRNHDLFFDAKTWCEKIFKNVKLGTTIAVTKNNYNSLSQNLFENLYKSSIDIQLASPINKELRMDDNDDDDLISE
ncbi:25978_t:CDS:2, partial [Gigaspora margarita]